MKEKEQTPVNRLHSLIYNFHMNGHGGNPKVFLVHPKMWLKIYEELNEMMVLPPVIDNPIRFQGVKIMRTLDIEETKIEIY